MSTDFPKQAVTNLIAAISEYRTIWDGDPEPFHPSAAQGPLVYLDTATSIAQGTDEFRSTWDDDEKTLTNEQSGLRRVTLRVKVKSYDVDHISASIIERIRTRLRRPSSLAALRAVDLSLIDCVAIDEVGMEADGRSICWGTMDVRLNWVASEVDTTENDGIIEYVNATIELNDNGTPEDEEDDFYEVTDPGGVVPGDLDV